MIGVVIAAGGLIFTFMTGYFDDNLQEQPRADIAVEPSGDYVDLVVRNAENVDDMEVRLNGETLTDSQSSLSGEVGDVAIVGDDPAESTDTPQEDLTSGEDTVTVVAIKNPDGGEAISTTVETYQH
jgi:FlaG/FlaF family flagellin (archaellin)